MRNALLALVGLGGLLAPITAHGYEVETHDAITRNARARSTLDEVLRVRLGFESGLGTAIRGQVLTAWLGQGGRREDDFLRFLNHFHNPLPEWSTAGLLGSVGQSSVRWGQNTSVSGWSWQDVRNAYLAALTRATRSDREASLAKAFE